MPQELQCKCDKLIPYSTAFRRVRPRGNVQVYVGTQPVCWDRQDGGLSHFLQREKSILPQYPTEKDKICATKKASRYCLNSPLWQVGVFEFSELSPTPCKGALHWSRQRGFCLWAASHDTSLQNHLCNLAERAFKVLGCTNSAQVASTSVLNTQSLMSFSAVLRLCFCAQLQMIDGVKGCKVIRAKKIVIFLIKRNFK